MDLLAQPFADAKVIFFDRFPYRRLRIFDVEADSVDAAYRPYMHPGTSRDRSNIAGMSDFLDTLLLCVVYNLLRSHEISARQG
jgi:hypothetical protein